VCYYTPTIRPCITDGMAKLLERVSPLRGLKSNFDEYGIDPSEFDRVVLRHLSIVKGLEQLEIEYEQSSEIATTVHRMRIRVHSEEVNLTERDSAVFEEIAAYCTIERMSDNEFRNFLSRYKK
jgi:hypothetical protein